MSTPGTELDYVEITATVNVSGLEAAPTAIVDGNAVTYDGLTRVKVEWYAQVVELPAGYYDLNIGLYEAGTVVTLLFGAFHNETHALDWTAYGSGFFTPTAGSHTYTVAGFRSPGSSGSAIVAASAQGGDYAPSWYRLTEA